MPTLSGAPIPKAPDGVALAWELAATVRPHLSRIDADHIYVALGTGETFAAIDALIAFTAQHRILLRDHLMDTLSTWLDGYVGQDAEPRLRMLLDELKTSMPQQMSNRIEQPGASLGGASDWQLRPVKQGSRNRCSRPG